MSKWKASVAAIVLSTAVVATCVGVDRVSFARSLTFEDLKSTLHRRDDGRLEVKFAGRIRNHDGQSVFVYFHTKSPHQSDKCKFGGLVLHSAGKTEPPLVKRFVKSKPGEATIGTSRWDGHYVHASGGESVAEFSQYGGETFYAICEPGEAIPFRDSFVITQGQWDALQQPLSFSIFARQSNKIRELKA